MKKNLLLFIILYVSLLLAESNLNTSYNSYNQSSVLENNFQWDEIFDSYWNVNFLTHYSYAQNSYFDRSSKNTFYNYKLSYDKYNLKPYLLYQTSYFYNTGLPEDSVSVNDKNIQKAGFGTNISFIENRINFFHENTYTKLNNSHNDYYGWFSKYALNYSNRTSNYLRNNRYDFTLYYNNNDVYLDRSKNAGINLIYNYQKTNNFLLRTYLDYKKNDIYSYNKKTDENELYDCLVEFKSLKLLTTSLIWDLHNQSNYKKTEYKENYNRNNRTFDNKLSYKLTYKSNPIDYYIVLNILYKKRYLKFNNQDRESFEKKLINGAIINFAMLDTFKIEIVTSLLQNFHSDSYNFLDNDRYLNSYNIYILKNFKNFHIANSFSYINGEQVYIDKLLSANNHNKKSYIWIPEFEYHFSKSLNIFNRYSIRADYETFIWNEYMNDRFFRNLNGEWGLKIKGYMNENNDNTFQIYTAFILEHSETAELLDDKWIQNINEYQRKYLISLTINHRFIYFKFQPLLKNFNDNYEIELQTDLICNVQDNLYFTISVNPVGKTFNQMIWRLNTSLKYNF